MYVIFNGTDVNVYNKIRETLQQKQQQKKINNDNNYYIVL